jgi:protein-disulfide isomerase-like protein with CxxC motif
MLNTKRPIVPLAYSAQPLIDAIAEYDRTAAERNAKWDNASCTLDIFAAEDADRDALSKVQEAFYQVTKDRNRREDCRRIDIDAMRRLAEWAVKNQEPELVAPGE